jgi:REP element-mobilizing transposase RayT
MRQLEFKKVNGWGGKRKGAGRPNRSGTASHTKRARIDFRKPLHITMRLKDQSVNLRTKAIFNSFVHAFRKAQVFGFHVIHFSLLSNHVHMVVEAKDNDCLERGTKSLHGRMGKILAKLSKGPAWHGRFHMHVLKTPTEVNRALKYVLLNYSKHDRILEHLDRFSSGRVFREWKSLLDINGLMKWQLDVPPLEPEDLGLSPPRSWLCRVGWLRAR